MKNADEKFCRTCGEIIKKEAEICPKCGVRQKLISNYNNGKKKSNSSGGTLSWIFGVIFALSGFGHLINNPLVGVMYLSISILLIPPIYKEIFIKRLKISLSNEVKIIIIIIILMISSAQIFKANMGL
jgi:hypothetical protein